VPLLPNGANIPVTNANRTNYILHTANYRLNLDMKPYTKAFLRGLESVIEPDWLRMFNEEELQVSLRRKPPLAALCQAVPTIEWGQSFMEHPRKSRGSQAAMFPSRDDDHVSRSSQNRRGGWLSAIQARGAMAVPACLDHQLQSLISAHLSFLLQMLIRGVQTAGLDLEELQQNVVYGNGYHSGHPTIQAFWQARSSCWTFIHGRVWRAPLFFANSSKDFPIEQQVS